VAHELELPKDRICKTQMLSVLVTEYADCSRPTQHRTQRGLRGVRTGKHKGQASSYIPGQRSRMTLSHARA
jgi:hypothetical protein